jgi:hypothetical protein
VQEYLAKNKITAKTLVPDIWDFFEGEVFDALDPILTVELGRKKDPFFYKEVIEWDPEKYGKKNYVLIYYGVGIKKDATGVKGHKLLERKTVIGKKTIKSVVICTD